MVEAGRVAEIIAEFPIGTDRGSGYRTSDTTVLTAAHVVANATRVRIRFDADTDTEWETVATAVWSDVASDLAVLSIESRADDLPPARFGRIGDGDAVLPATAVGFPLWKLKNYDGTVVTEDGRPRYRDSHQATGMIAVLSNRREGTLEFTVTPPDRDAGPEPWQGMSGAALWAGDRIVGVIARHHRTDGLGRLTAVRLDRGMTPELLNLLRLKEFPSETRSRESELALTGYRKQVEAIAPRELLDREDELAELTRFVAGAELYLWWQAGPWAGKTALMSWFVLHPPEGVDVVSFFVTGRRLGGQEDSDAFTEELAVQIAAITGEHLQGDGRSQFWRLLDDAAEHAQRTTRRLLIVIDGLDEDAGPAHGKPSIASLLPLDPPEGVRILIASRPDPQVPDDVLDEHHPLLTCRRRQLTVSPHARSIKRRAVHELNQHLTGDELHRDVLGLITASGGGLTRADLEELTRRPPYEIDRLLDGPLSRTIGSRPARLRPDENKPVHLFAHETLAETAQAKFGASIRSYRDRLHTWADGYREKSWPPGTPQYLLLGYAYVLVDAGDHDRLVAVSTDRARHDRMLETSGGDALATSEVRSAQDVLRRQPAPDLSALLLLAAHNDELAHRNRRIPIRLPVVWMMLGDAARAEALARGITDPQSLAQSLVALAEIAARTGDRERLHTFVTDARTLTRGFPDSSRRDEVLAELTKAVGAADPDLAISIAHEISEPSNQDGVLSGLAEWAEQHQKYELTLRFCASIEGTFNRDRTLVELARAAAAAGYHERASVLFGGVIEYYGNIVDEFVLDAIAANDQERVHQLLRAIADPDKRARCMAVAADTAAGQGQREFAMTFVPGITNPEVRAPVLARLATAFRDAGDRDQATSLLTEAWADTRGITDGHERAGMMLQVAAAMAGGDGVPIPILTEARDIVRTMPDATKRTELLSQLVGMATPAGDPSFDRALLVEAAHSVDQIIDPQDRHRAREQILSGADAIGEDDWISAWLSGIADPGERATATAILAEVAADSDDSDRALSLLIEAAALTRTLKDRDDADNVLARIVGTAARGGHHERALALALANDIVDIDLRDEVLAYEAEAARVVGDPEWALSLARHIVDDDDRDRSLADVAKTASYYGDADLALRTLENIHSADDRDGVLGHVAQESAKTGVYERARELAARITEPSFRIDIHVALVQAAAANDAWDQVAAIGRDAARDEDADVATLVNLVTNVAEADAPDLAHTLAWEVSDPSQLPAVLISLANQAHTAGDPDRVERLISEVATLVEALPDPDDRTHVLADAVDVALAAGRQERALAVARDVADTYQRALAFTKLAEAAAGTAEHSTARELGMAAESAARGVDSATWPDSTIGLAIASLVVGEQDRARRLAMSASRGDARAHAQSQLALVSAGDPVAARSLLTDAQASAMEVTDIHDRAEVLTNLVRVAGLAGQSDLLRSVLTEAEDAIAAVTEVELRVSLLAGLTRVVVEAGRHDAARSLLTGAESLLTAVGDSDRRAAVLAKVAEIAIAAGDLRRAQVIAGGITNPYEQREVLTSLALAAGRSGDHDLAQSVVSGIDEVRHRREVLRALIAQATEAGEHSRARLLATTEPHWLLQGEMLTWLARVATLTQDHDAALSLVKEISDENRLADGLFWLVRAAVATGDHERARTVAEEIPESDRAEAELYLSGATPATPGLFSGLYPTAPIIDALIAAGDRESALAVARETDTSFGQVAELTKVVDAEVAAGDLDRATAVTREITDPAGRAVALSRVVEALSSAGDTARARTLLAEVLALGPWPDAVMLVAWVAPDALVPVLDQLEARHLGQ